MTGKKLFAVPIAVLGQAASQASLPFFARLFGEKRLQEFAETVNGSIYRIVAAALLASSLMTAAALPLVDLVYRHGHRFHFSDSQATAAYFFWFSLSLAFWSAQGLYARAFYAAGNTLTPMIASTVITVASLPLYSFFFSHFSAVGLAIASDIGIAANCVSIAYLLHRRRLVPFSGLDWNEIAKAFGIAICAAVISLAVSRLIAIHGARTADLEALGLIIATWTATVLLGLWITKSTLLRDLRRRA